jgi:electron transfer flavoprotein alpha subunit
MGNVLVFIEQQPDGNLRKASLNALTCGAQLAQKSGGELHAVVLAKDANPIANVVKEHGVKTVHAASGAQFEHYLAETFAPAIAELAKTINAEWVGGAGTQLGRDLLPRVAVRLDAVMASEVMSVLGEGANLSITRPMWAGAVIAEVKLTTAKKVFTVRGTEFAPAAKGAAGTVSTFTPAAVTPKSKHLEFKEVKSARPQLTEAKIIVSGGRGTQGNFAPIEGLADELGAAVGASRAVCDAGWQPNDLQVGQTGKVVAPQLYIAAGISGAIQHLAGMKGSKTIVAINKDAEAPIFQVADYGLVGDLFKVMPELQAAIKAGK